MAFTCSTSGPREETGSTSAYSLGGMLEARTITGVSSGTSAYSRVQSGRAAPKKGFSMLDEVRGYVREYKDWIFTIVIIAIVDHFFLDGALKEKLATALGKKLDGADGVSK